MNNKKAIVFDTNFIIQNKDLEEVVARLSDEFTPYVSQVTIDERIAQQCREYKKKFDRIESIKEESKWIAKIEFITSYEEYSKYLKKAVQNNYNNLFHANIFLSDYDDEMLKKVVERANYKTPPFATDENASDKGFKDTLIWISLISFFKQNGEAEVVLLTDDKGFLNNKETLQKEFFESTGKTITIYPNSYYNTLIEKDTTDVEEKEIIIPDKAKVDELRDNIRNAVYHLCYVDDYDPVWGVVTSEKTFITDKRVNGEYMKNVFDNIENILYDHIFETEIAASEIFDLDGRVSDTDNKIPMKNLEDAVEMYSAVKAEYEDFLQQFYNATAAIVNTNFVEPNHFDDDDIPF